MNECVAKGNDFSMWDNGSTLALTMDDDFEVLKDYYDIKWR